jgi:hypothetical protein
MFMRSGHLRYHPFPSVPERRGGASAWRSDFGIAWAALISLRDRTTRGEPPPIVACRLDRDRGNAT